MQHSKLMLPTYIDCFSLVGFDEYSLFLSIKKGKRNASTFMSIALRNRLRGSIEVEPGMRGLIDPDNFRPVVFFFKSHKMYM